MLCDVYRSTKHPIWYLIVPSGRSVPLMPPQLGDFVDGLTLLKTREISEGDKLIGADSTEVLKNISEQGYHLQSIQIQSNVSVAGTALGGGVLGATFGGGLGAVIGSVIGFAVAQTAKEKEEKNVF